MKRVLTVGVFDLFHVGHLNFLERARQHGDYLIVAVHDDKQKSKGKDFFFDIDDRIRLIRGLRIVDEATIYERVDLIVEQVCFDVFCHGPDQNHEYFARARSYCAAHNKRVVLLERTPGISSTAIREFIDVQGECDGKYYS